MQTRKLGRQGLEVSAIGLGCMGMSIAYGERDDEESTRTLHMALDRGITLLDSADRYGNGKNETLLGKALVGRRDRAIIATKFGNRELPDGGRDICGHPDYVKEACDASLQRLGIDTIDLYYQHRVDDKVPIEDTVGAMAELVKAGKVRYLGLSEAGPDTIRRAHATHPISALQTEYSLWTRDVETELLPLCRELGIGFVAYSPLGRGFLSARIRQANDLIEKDRRHDHPRFQAENIAQNLTLLEPLQAIASAKACSPAQLAIAWVLAQGEDIVPIPGTKQRKWLQENIAALDISLDQTEMQRLEAVFQLGTTAGERYPVGQLKRLGI
jgi:aryl-alcohol dehydrogenase-like predicted oxidoreductase